MKSIEEEIKGLERKIEELMASRPAHDFTELHDTKILRLEDELDEKRKLFDNSKEQV